MTKYASISPWLLFAAFLAAPSICPQSYDVGDVAPPVSHTERSPLLPGGSIFFEGKYKLLVDLDCANGDLIVEVRLKGGAVPNSIEVLDDSVVAISLTPSIGGRRNQISTKLIVPRSFDIYAIMENDTAKFRAEYSEDSIILRTFKDTWFIEPEHLLQLPRETFWFFSNNSKTARKLIDTLNHEGLAEYIILEEGYYRCFPSGYVWKAGKKNQCRLGTLYFFKFRGEPDTARIHELISHVGKDQLWLGMNARPTPFNFVRPN